MSEAAELEHAPVEPGCEGPDVKGPDAKAPDVRGWCPGALRPMASGDGLVVRVRARCGALPLATLATLADVAARLGNGHIDITRRANLQLRGVSDATLPAVLGELARLGLIDASPEAEAVRNVMVAPLAGLDAGAADVRPIVRELEAMLAEDGRLQALPGKFGYVVDGGGRLAVSGETADIIVGAGAGAATAAIGIAQRDGWRMIGSVARFDAAEAARRVALAFQATRAPGPRGRMRDATAEQVSQIRDDVAPLLVASDGEPFGTSSAPVADRIGHLALGGDVHVIGVGAPFGRLEAAQLAALATALGDGGAGEVRLSPWRALYAAVRDADAARVVLAAAADAGLIVDASDPLLAVEACTGAPDCPQARGETRTLARRLATVMAASGFAGPLHVSGCAKGCARSVAAPLTLVADGALCHIVRDGTAGDTPTASIATDDLTAAPQRLLAFASPATIKAPA